MFEDKDIANQPTRPKLTLSELEQYTTTASNHLQQLAPGMFPNPITPETQTEGKLPNSEGCISAADVINRLSLDYFKNRQSGHFDQMGQRYLGTLSKNGDEFSIWGVSIAVLSGLEIVDTPNGKEKMYNPKHLRISKLCTVNTNTNDVNLPKTAPLERLSNMPGTIIPNTLPGDFENIYYLKTQALD